MSAKKVLKEVPYDCHLSSSSLVQRHHLDVGRLLVTGAVDAFTGHVLVLAGKCSVGDVFHVNRDGQRAGSGYVAGLKSPTMTVEEGYDSEIRCVDLDGWSVTLRDGDIIEVSQREVVAL